MIPINIGGLFSSLGSAAGGMAASGQLGAAGSALERGADAASQYLTAGRDAATKAYDPYTATGKQGLSDYAAGTAASGNIAAPRSTLNGFNFDVWKDPSAQYTMDMSNDAIQARALAGGQFSSGTMKNIAANTTNLAKTNYTDAYNRYMANANQQFQQAQTQYQDQNQQQQQKLANQAALAGMGLQATNANQQLASGYNQGLAGLFNGLGENQANVNVMNASNLSHMWNGIGSGLSSMFSGPSGAVGGSGGGST